MPRRDRGARNTKGRQMPLTPIQILLHLALDRALIHIRHALALERLPILARVKHARRVHRALERIALPPKHVIRMRAIAEMVAIAEDKGVRPVRRPHVVEAGRVPERLEGELGHAHRVGRRAGAGGREGFLDGVVHVRLVVGGVEVLAVPAAVGEIRISWVKGREEEGGRGKKVGLTWGSGAPS